MNAATKRYVFRPFLLADSLVWVFVIPTLIAIFGSLIPALKHEVPTIAAVLGITGMVHLSLALWSRYHYMKPVIAVMEDEAGDERTLYTALRQASRLPLFDVLFFYVVRALIISLIPVMSVLFLLGKISLAEGVFGAVLVSFTVMTCLPYWYLACEINLAPFYAKAGSYQGFATAKGILHLSMKNKIFICILLTSVPAAFCYFAVILYADFAGIPYQKTYLGLALLVVQLLVLAFFNSKLLTRGFEQSVGNMTAMLETMAQGQGDLTRRLRVAGVDEVGNLAFYFNAFVNNLEDMVAMVKASTEQIHTTISEVSEGSQEISGVTQEQASAIQQVAATVDELHCSVENAVGLVQEGRMASTRLIKLVEEDYRDVHELMGAIQEISDSSRKIGGIVTTVNEVAFQTNILALNAAVEAARAGEHGKGFAVVASEVRALAVRSAQASDEINTLISTMVARIKAGNAMMHKNATRFEGLKEMIASISRAMETISASSQEQKQSINELYQCINQIDDATQHNAATIEEFTAITSTMNAEADTLQENVARFKVSRQSLERWEA